MSRRPSAAHRARDDTHRRRSSGGRSAPADWEDEEPAGRVERPSASLGSGDRTRATHRRSPPSPRDPREEAAPLPSGIPAAGPERRSPWVVSSRVVDRQPAEANSLPSASRNTTRRTPLSYASLLNALGCSRSPGDQPRDAGSAAIGFRGGDAATALEPRGHTPPARRLRAGVMPSHDDGVHGMQLEGAHPCGGGVACGRGPGCVVGPEYAEVMGRARWRPWDAARRCTPLRRSPGRRRRGRALGLAVGLQHAEAPHAGVVHHWADTMTLPGRAGLRVGGGLLISGASVSSMSNASSASAGRTCRRSASASRQAVGEALQAVAPAVGGTNGVADRLPAVAVAVEVAVLELDPRAGRALGDETHLSSLLREWSVSSLTCTLTARAEHNRVRRLQACTGPRHTRCHRRRGR